MKEQICNNCNFCIKDDGKPYCFIKKENNKVDLKHVCDEKDIYGKPMITHSSSVEK